MFRKLLLIAIISFSFLLFASFAEDNKPVVIALSPFFDFSGLRDSSHMIKSQRNKVTANLLQNYNCVILSRSAAKTLSFEKSIESIKDLKGVAIPPLPAADYSIVGLCNIGKRAKDKNNHVYIGCSLLLTDLRVDAQNNSTTKDINKNINDNYRKIDFITDKSSWLTDEITSQIVKALKLVPEQKKRVIRKGKINETWTVLPIQGLELLSQLHKAKDYKELSIAMELSLQESGRLKQIVDHSEVDKILKELQLTEMGSSTESTAGGIGRLVGADKIIMGSVSRAHFEKPELRLDIFLVDAKTSIILDSATVKCKKDELMEKASDLVLNFIKYENKVPQLEFAGPYSLKKEALIYAQIFFKIRETLKFNYRANVAIPLAETIFLLVKNDQQIIYDIAGSLLFDILGEDSPLDEKELPLKEKRRVVDSILRLLNEVEFSENTKFVLVRKANALKYLPDRIEEAISFVEKHLREHPETSAQYANYIIADCYYRKRDYKKALEFAEKSGHGKKGNVLRIKLYEILKDPENDEKELIALDHLDLTGGWYGTEWTARYLDLLRRLRKPGDALEYAKEFNSWQTDIPEILLEIAKCYIDLGNKEYAASILDGLDYREAMKRSQYKGKDKRSELIKEIMEVRNKLGVAPPPFKKLSEFHHIPDKYKVYIVPLGKTDMDLIKCSIPYIEDNMGCKVKVFPQIPLADDPVTFARSRGKYGAKSLIRRLRHALDIPEDAISIVALTGKPLYTKGYDYINSTSDHKIRLLSNYRYIAIDYDTGSQILAKGIIHAYLVTNKDNNKDHICFSSKCLNAGGGGLRKINKSFSLCIMCQDWLKNVNAESVYKKFQKTANCDCENKIKKYDKKEYVNRYDCIVRKALTEAEEKTTEVVKYIPSVKLDSPKPGLKYKYYEFEPKNIKKTEDLLELKPVDIGIADELGLKTSKAENHFGIVYDGYIKVPKDGKYQFLLSSGGAVDIFIGDKKVLFNRGSRVKSKYGEIALQAGYHPIKVFYYFDFVPWKDKNGELTKEKFFKFMEIRYRSPEIFTQKIPKNILFHKE